MNNDDAAAGQREWVLFFGFCEASLDILREV